MNKITEMAKDYVASVGRKELVVARNVTALMGVFLMAVAITGGDASPLLVSPSEMQSFVKQCIEAVL